MNYKMLLIAVAATIAVFNLIAVVPAGPDQNFHPICEIGEKQVSRTGIKCIEKEKFIQSRCKGKSSLCFGVESDGWDTDLVGYGPCRNCGCKRAPFQYATLEYKSDASDTARHWQEKQLEAIKEAVTSLKRVYLVIFVHGWGHDAWETPDVEDPDKLYSRPPSQDKNLRYFKDILAKSRHELVQRGDTDRKVLGVYVGWNGNTGIYPLSIGSRAGAADRIGTSEQFAADLNTLIDALRRADPSNRALIMGHSLGGRMLARFLLKQSGSGVLEPLGSNVLVATINPAIGADAFDDYMALPPRPGFPYWINVTSKHDWATGYLFPTAATIGRVLGFGRGISDKLLVRAGYQTIGHYDDYQTHRLDFEYFKPRDCKSGQSSDRSFSFAGYPGILKDRATLWYHLDDGQRSNHRAVYFGNQCDAAYYYSKLTIEKRHHAVAGAMWNMTADNKLIEGDIAHRNRTSSHNSFVQTSFNRMLIELLFEK